MNQTDIVNAATQAAQKSKNLIGQQVDKQAAALGGTLAQTARDLGQVGSNLRESGTIGSAAQLADWAADYVKRAGTYLTDGHTDQFIGDLEAFGRERPWAIATSAAVLGFFAARVVKSSSVRRYKASAYTDNSDRYTGMGYAVASGASDSTYKAGSTTPATPEYAASTTIGSDVTSSGSIFTDTGYSATPYAEPKSPASGKVSDDLHSTTATTLHSDKI